MAMALFCFCAGKTV